MPRAPNRVIVTFVTLLAPGVSEMKRSPFTLPARKPSIRGPGLPRPTTLTLASVGRPAGGWYSPLGISIVSVPGLPFVAWIASVRLHDATSHPPVDVKSVVVTVKVAAMPPGAAASATPAHASTVTMVRRKPKPRPPCSPHFASPEAEDTTVRPQRNRHNRFSFMSAVRENSASARDADLVPYLPRLVRSWSEERGTSRRRVLDGSLVSADVSGFTALSERLAARGREGAEELVETISSVFDGLIQVAERHGGDVLKFRGDALLLLLVGDRHPERACGAASDMQRAIGSMAGRQTSVGAVELRMACGVHSGDVHVFLTEVPTAGAARGRARRVARVRARGPRRGRRGRRQRRDRRDGRPGVARRSPGRRSAAPLAPRRCEPDPVPRGRRRA